MFEIWLDEKGMNTERREDEEDQEEEVGGGRQNGELCLHSLILPLPPQQEVDPLNQTLSIQEGEELQLRDWSEKRKGWTQRAPQTLLNALANIDVNSVYNTAVEADQGASSLHHS